MGGVVDDGKVVDFKLGGGGACLLELGCRRQSDTHAAQPLSPAQLSQEPGRSFEVTCWRDIRQAPTGHSLVD